uniref:Uncharacterized protein n=1 Tax=Anguilla anguilla TaxID=7936 RepID=A0A0E9SCX0_ANGAN
MHATCNLDVLSDVTDTLHKHFMIYFLIELTNLKGYKLNIYNFNVISDFLFN